jgi:NAD(P) transhydrogenase subunit alpha
MVLIHVPRETEPGETRVAVVPDTVKSYVKAGLEVCVESNAGLAAGFTDEAYRDAGATIGDRLGEADLVLRVRTPRVEPDEISKLKKGAMLVSSLMPTLALPAVRALAEQGVVAFGLELVPRITRAQKMDILSSQATVAGYQAVVLAAAHLPKMFPLLMTAAGTITPARVFVLGAGVAGLQAIATARRLGATVEANDVRPATRDQVESLGGKFVDTGSPPEAQGTGGYAKETSEEYLRKQKEILTAHIEQADVLITTANIPGRKAPLLVDASMRAKMRPGSVIVDLAAPTGGNVEGTKPGEVAVVEGVTILGELNLPSRCAADASRMWSKNVSEFVGLLVADGKIAPNFEDEILAASLITRDGQVAHEGARDALAGGKQS